MGLIEVQDFLQTGWLAPEGAEQRARWYCERLEEGEILFFPSWPFALSKDAQSFLLNVRQTASAHHKNISYKPGRERVKGFRRGSADEMALLGVMRSYSQAVTAFVRQFLSPYDGRWRLDYASFRPIEEEGRDLPVRMRNDLLHVDSFPTRPSNGDRILRVFTNLNPSRPRVWLTSDPFDVLVRKYGDAAGLPRVAAEASSPWRAVKRRAVRMARALGLPLVDRPLYDEFMLGFHHYLKNNREFQGHGPKLRWEFPPGSAWLVYTDMVPHAVLAGQFALEQTFLVSRDALLLPQKAPYRIIQELTGVPVTG